MYKSPKQGRLRRKNLYKNDARVLMRRYIKHSIFKYMKPEKRPDFCEPRTEGPWRGSMPGWLWM